MTTAGDIIRKIIHIDMDAFFASVEQRDFPELKGKPVVVGSPSKRGVIAAASYEARKFGIKSAMASQTAIKKCPDLIFQKHRFDVYKSVSAQIMNILHEYSDLVEPLSIDEAFIDVTENKKGLKSATIIAKEIKKKIFEETQLTASAGISINKFLAKTASDVNKPNGIFVIKPEDVINYMELLPVYKFYGVGQKTAQRMNQLGIYTGKDLKSWSLNGLVKHFGKSGVFFYNICRGIDDRSVVPNRKRKSIGIENTFHSDIITDTEREKELNTLIADIWERATKKQMFGRTLTLKIKYNDFSVKTFSKTLTHTLHNQQDVAVTANELLKSSNITKPIRLIGLSISNFESTNTNKPYQLTINFD